VRGQEILAQRGHGLCGVGRHTTNGEKTSHNEETRTQRVFVAAELFSLTFPKALFFILTHYNIRCIFMLHICLAVVLVKTGEVRCRDEMPDPKNPWNDFHGSPGLSETKT
jgi:hypothetical protein